MHIIYLESSRVSKSVGLNTMMILHSSMSILKIEPEIDVLNEEERKAYLEAFQDFDGNNTGKIPNRSLLFAMRRVGLNPTDVEVQDVINRIDEENGSLSFSDFSTIVTAKKKEANPENYFKESFRVFSKDDEGCIPAEELKFVLQNLPGKVC